MKKTITAVICLTLCLSTAACSFNSSNVPSSETEENTASAVSLTTETQTESSEVQTTAKTFSNQNEQQISTSQQTTTSNSLRFSDLPSEFVFSSGAGAWETVLTIHTDGTFDGIFTDRDYMEMYYSTFNGKLGQPKKTGDFTYLVTIDEFHVTNDQDLVYYEEGVKYIPSDPYGLENVTSELILYSPGMSISEMPEECKSWLTYYENSTLSDGDYVLYNAKEGNAFLGLH